MFKVDANPKFTHDVDVKVPVDGGFETQSLKATFRVLDDDVLKAADFDTFDGQKEFLRLALVQLDDLQDEAGKPLPYNDKLRDQILGLPYARTALLRGYTEGIVPGAMGNFVGLAGLG